MGKQNCWEFMACGRELGGGKADELGVCPSAVETWADGINGGKNGGRACWAIAGSFVSKKDKCLCVTEGRDCSYFCRFYWLVMQEEREHFVTATESWPGSTSWDEGDKAAPA